MAEIDYFDDPSAYGRRSQPASGYSYGHPDDPYDTDDPGGSRFGVLVNWAGALVSLGLVVGMGVWAWQLTTRDVSGVPVIEALEGPMRVAPEDPGGAQAPHQGLAVNRIAEGEAAEAVPDQLALAPAPVGLDDVAPIVAPDPAPEAAATPRTGLPADVNAETQALIERLLERGSALDTGPITPPAPIEEPTAAAETATSSSVASPQVTVIPASVPGVSRSLRPVVRPTAATAPDVALEITNGESPGAAVAPGSEIAPQDLPVGTRLVQLGAFDSPEIARSEWERLSDRFPDFLAGRARVIEEARSGGQAFYRLRAHGFDDLAAARRFCTALVAQGAACIPVTVR